MKPERKLLRRIAAIPAGERLPIARFARELNCSQSVVIGMVQGLIADSLLDAATLRAPGDVAVTAERPKPRANCKHPGECVAPRRGPCSQCSDFTKINAAAKCRRDQRAARGLPPSRNEILETQSLERIREQRERVAQGQASAELGAATRRPGESVADAIRRIARDVAPGAEPTSIGSFGQPVAARDKRRSGTFSPTAPTVAHEDDPEEGIGDLTRERRAAELRDVASPSALIRRATQDWPDKCAAVAAVAVQLGVQKGEAWLRVIERGVAELTRDMESGLL